MDSWNEHAGALQDFELNILRTFMVKTFILVTMKSLQMMGTLFSEWDT